MINLCRQEYLHMIKCLECGFEAERLQWTHFLYKCTGRFKNGKEYQKVYQNAKLVSPELSKKTAITLENLILKYGEQEGKNRWDSYREKQANTNKFEYKQEKYGWTKDQHDQYNSSRSVTFAKMIERHGEIEGSKRWIEYCEKQAYTNSLAYFIEKYGNELGHKKYHEVNKVKGSSSNPILLAEKLKITPEAALQIILSRSIYPGNIWGSKLEEDFVQNLEITLGKKLEHTTFSVPYGKWISKLNHYVIYDIKHENYVIEFNGDYWHANPKLYKCDALIRGKRASEIWNYDKVKQQAAIELGFNFKTVWESDYKQNKDKIIKEVCEWMQNGQK